MKITDVTANQIVWAVGFFLCLIGIYTTVMGARKVHREESQRRNQPMDEVRQMLANDKNRLDNHETAIRKLNDRTDAQDAELKLILRGQLALIRHGIDGNNLQGLKDEQKAIQDHLIDK